MALLYHVFCKTQCLPIDFYRQFIKADYLLYSKESIFICLVFAFIISFLSYFITKLIHYYRTCPNPLLYNNH